MGYEISTTGTVPVVTINDIPMSDGNPLTFTHPVVSYDPLQFYDQEDLRASIDLQTAIAAGELTLALNGALIDDISNVGVSSFGVANTPGGSGGGPTDYSVSVFFNAGTYDLEPGTKATIVVPTTGTITALTMIAGQVGTIVVGINKATFSAYPTATSITGTNQPTITSGAKSQDSTLTSWSTAVAAGDILEFEIDSNSGIKQLELSLTVEV